METQKMKTAVVILNWNGKNWLEKFLQNVIFNSSDATVIVVDNNSSDNSVSFLQEQLIVSFSIPAAYPPK